MDWVAVVLTFSRAALSGAAVVALGVLLITLLLARRNRRALALSLLMAMAWFLISLFSIHALLGQGMGSIEVVSYGSED